MNLSLAPSRVKTFNRLKQLHAQLILHSLHGSNHWLSFLLHRCVQVGAPLAYAHQLFESIPQPNIHAFTSMFKLYSRMGTPNDVFAAFCLMSDLTVTPNATVFPILIKSLGSAAIWVHAHVLKLGHVSNHYVQNAIMNFYIQSGTIELAENLFDEMQVRAVADWNSLLSGYWKWGCKGLALKLFDMMPERNIISWTCMVTGLSRLGELEEARRFFNEMPERSVVSWNAMLSGYTQNGRVGQALKFFGLMKDAGIQLNETTWVAVISICSLKGDLELAESIVGSLRERHLHMNCFVRTALINMYANCGSLQRARQVFYESKDWSLASCNAIIAAYTREGDLLAARQLFEGMPVKDVISWNSMVSGYAQNGQWSSAIELFRKMTSMKGLKPDDVTISSVLSACGHLGTLQCGTWIVNYIKENQISLSISGYNALIFMYSRCGLVEDAKRIFDEMWRRDVFSYNTLISGMAAHGYGLEAIKLLNMMEEEGIKPDNITFLGILTACSHAGLSIEGCQIFELIKNPTVDHYACKVDLLCRTRQLDEAMRVIEDMPMKPHAGVYGALLNASRINRRVELGEFAAKELFRLEPDNSGNYVLLSNLYAAVGRWEDMDGVRRSMVERGISKMVGYSWVEFNGKVHRFIAGDQLHSLSQKIYKVLKELRRKIQELGYIADKSFVLKDVHDEEKEEMLDTHSEKLAVAFGLLVFEAGTVIRVVKNLRICDDCHIFLKMVSGIEGKEIVVRDNNRFHRFMEGRCSCKDHW
ncbi:pentatricopeptide repeat-containing protein At3g62890 [Typha latifolia]|uniref:pentatricopeptide repeat-containing protein At3g62890 n=1 Tax=Typha latifolia TaxID=4733 RepID=UPI003C2B6F44